MEISKASKLDDIFRYYSFPSFVRQFRAIIILALLIQTCVLFMESDRIGIYFVIPLAVHALNLYQTGKRAYYKTDGRYDLSQLLTLQNIHLKGRYTIALFGSISLALISHFSVDSMPSMLNALLYRLSDYIVILSATAILCVEIYEFMREKM